MKLPAFFQWCYKLDSRFVFIKVEVKWIGCDIKNNKLIQKLDVKSVEVITKKGSRI